MIGSYLRTGELTPRLVSVLVGASMGETRAQTAARLHLSPKTVDTERRVAVARLGARNTTHAVAIAVGRGIIRPPQ
jgi:LuxR family transcriptional regulator, quorum-sensing system regulator RaiR